MESVKQLIKRALRTISNMHNIRPNKKLNSKLKSKLSRQSSAVAIVVLNKGIDRDKACLVSSKRLMISTKGALVQSVEEISFIKTLTFCLQQILMTRSTSLG